MTSDQSRGVFETIRVRNGVMPFLAQHLERMREGARASGLALPADAEARVRGAATVPDLIVRASLDPDGVAVTTRPVPEQRGFAVVISPVVHRPYPHKSTDRAVFDQARADAEAGGADEALLLTTEGFLAEGAITSVAFWKNGGLCLPAPSLGILPGIGRARLIALVRAAGIRVEEGAFVAADWEGRPLLLVNAVRGPIPVASVDGRPVPVFPLSPAVTGAFWP